MESIRGYTGPIYLCDTCGQPCYDGKTEYGSALEHFTQQWDGVHCDTFPLATGPIRINWTRMSLTDVKASYPDTHPR